MCTSLSETTTSVPFLPLGKQGKRPEARFLTGRTIFFLGPWQAVEHSFLVPTPYVDVDIVSAILMDSSNKANIKRIFINEMLTFIACR